ncbi:MAG: hypothetical protein CMP54_00385 [Flavobacteriales bacterium]|nr:hypothetical protein [Flavobacteriales bacterium]
MFFAVHISVYSQSKINDIKNGALLVRIQTNQHLIDHYVKDKLLDKTNTFTYHSNNDSIRIIHILPQKKSDAIKTKQSHLNKDIINAFETEWSLSPVYYFYSNFSNEIRNNIFTNVFKADKTKLSAKEKSQLNNNFLIAYIGDTPGSLKFNALVLTDRNFKTLAHPWPKYVRTYDGLWFLKRKLSKSIQILEKKLDFQLSRIK